MCKSHEECHQGDSPNWESARVVVVFARRKLSAREYPIDASQLAHAKIMPQHKLVVQRDPELHEGISRPVSYRYYKAHGK